MTAPTDDGAARAKKIAKYAAVIGAVLAIACHALPADYRPVCELVAQVCRGGL